MTLVSFDIPALKKDFPVEVSPSHSLSWNIAYSTIKEKFAFGYGPENFSMAFDKFGSSALSGTSLSNIKFYDSASQFFNFLIHGGVILGAAIVFLLVTVVWQIIKRYRSRLVKNSSENGVVAMMLALFTALFLYPFNLSLMFMLYVSLAIVTLTFWEDGKKYYSIEKSPMLSLTSSLGFIGGLVIVLIAIYFNVLSYVAEVKFAQVARQSDGHKAANLLAEAVRWNNRDDKYYRSLSQVSLSLLSIEIGKSKDDPNRGTNVQNYVSSAVSFARKATEVNPKESMNWSNLGGVYANLLGIVENVEKLSEEAYLKASEFRPGDPNYYAQIGNLYLTKGDVLKRLAGSDRQNSVKINEEAFVAYIKSEEAFKKAIDISNNFGQAIYNLGTVYERQGKVGEAVKQLEKLAPFNSNQPGLMFELGLLYYRVGRKDDAFNQLQRAIVLAPDYANAHWYLASIYEERGDIESAVKQLESILGVEVNKDNAEVIARLDALKKGKKTGKV